MKVNLTAQLEFELAYFEATVLHFGHYTTRTPLWNDWTAFCKDVNTREKIEYILGVFLWLKCWTVE